MYQSLKILQLLLIEAYKNTWMKYAIDFRRNVSCISFFFQFDITAFKFLPIQVEILFTQIKKKQEKHFALENIALC